MTNPTLEQMLAALERSRLHEGETSRLYARLQEPDASMADFEAYGKHHLFLQTGELPE